MHHKFYYQDKLLFFEQLLFESIKQSDHAVEQLNCDSDPVKGLVKRSGTQHISTLINNEVSITCWHQVQSSASI